MAVSLVGLNPEYRARLDLFLAEVGLRAYVRSGVRTTAEQTALYKAYLAGTGNLAARPGTSNHEVRPPHGGIATDINPRAGSDYSLIHSVGKKYGFHFPIKGEPWHMEMSPTRKPLPTVPIQPVKVFPVPQKVDAAKNTRGPGHWVLSDDGGVRAVHGAPFFGSYPGLPEKDRQGTRSFISIEELADRPGYVLFGDDDSFYVFAGK